MKTKLNYSFNFTRKLDGQVTIPTGTNYLGYPDDYKTSNRDI